MSKKMGSNSLKLTFRESFSGTYNVRVNDVCIANCGIGKDWCTVYLIETNKEYRGKGEAQKLLKALKNYCEQTNRTLRLWRPMNNVIKHICTKIGIETV